MTKLPFCDHHLLQLVEGYEQQSLPIDLFISHYFRAHHALGSKDRGKIVEDLYGMIRWQELIDHFCESPVTWSKRLELYRSSQFETLKTREDIPVHLRCSFPAPLFQAVANSHGESKAFELCLISNQQAPTTIRANALKTTRDALMERLKDRFPVKSTSISPWGIIFDKKTNFFTLPEFKDGLFEVQDEGSQLIAELINAKPGQWVMDYCAGSGGKTLAFAPLMENKGQIFLIDVRPRALLEAKKRLCRAGIQNAQRFTEDDPKLKKMKKKMDWVLVDAPCSGTGTLRRNPDMKKKFSPTEFKELLGLQRKIFEKALSFLKPDGRIVYATCSILNEENQHQADHFVRTYDLQIEGEPFQSLPTSGGMDGFYGVVLKKKN